MNKIEIYKIALQIAYNEGRILWDSSQVFLFSNTILGAIIAAQTADVNVHKDLKIFILSIIGFIITSIWFTSHQKRSSYYKFRMAKVRALEPLGFNLIDGDGFAFSQGAEVDIKGKYYRLPFLSRFINTHTIIQLVILVFEIGYIILMLVSYPY